MNTKTMTNEPSTTPAEPSNPELYQQAIEEGKLILADSGSKASAARRIFELIHTESREIVLRAFIEGAEVTPKGAPNYFYNIQRKFKRKAKASQSD